MKVASELEVALACWHVGVLACWRIGSTTYQVTQEQRHLGVLRD